MSGFLHKWAIPAVDGFGILLCGVVAFGLVLVFEPIYTNAREQGILGKRFARITGIQVTVFVVSGLWSLFWAGDVCFWSLTMNLILTGHITPDDKKQ